MTSPKDESEPTTDHRIILRLCGVLVVLLVAVYAIAVTRGLPKENRIDATTLGVIGAGVVIALVLFKPDLFSRVTHLEIAGWKFEIEQKQLKQDKQLQDIELVLAILLTDAERKHLLNLDNNQTSNYEGNRDVRTELRRLASINLIQRRTGRNIESIADKTRVDLADFVKLTDTGQRLAARIKQIKAAQEKEREGTAATHT